MTLKSCALKWVGYLEHLTEDNLWAPTENVGKGGCTIFASIVRHYYPWRNYMRLPWCTTFVYAVFLDAYGKVQACHLLGKPHPGVRVLARRLKRHHAIRDTDYRPQCGDLIFLTNDGRRIGHVGIVVDTTDTEVVSVEGNTVDPSGVFLPKDGGAVAIWHRSFADQKIVCYAHLNVKQ